MGRPKKLIDIFKSDSSPAKRLRTMRESLGLSVNQAAERIGVDVSTYRQYESGRRVPSLEQLHRFAMAWGGDPNVLDPRLKEVPGNDQGQ